MSTLHVVGEGPQVSGPGQAAPAPGLPTTSPPGFMVSSTNIPTHLSDKYLERKRHRGLGGRGQQSTVACRGRSQMRGAPRKSGLERQFRRNFQLTRKLRPVWRWLTVRPARVGGPGGTQLTAHSAWIRGTRRDTAHSPSSQDQRDQEGPPSAECRLTGAL